MITIQSTNPSRSKFIKKPTQKITSKPDYKPGFRKLPFVAKWRTKETAQYWTVPASGGYIGGYEVGAAMATAMLKFMRASEHDVQGYLPNIVESFARRIEEEGGSKMVNAGSANMSESYSSLRGQYVGFFNTLAGCLATASRVLGANLDRVSEAELIARANRGLSFDEPAYIASLDDGEQS